MKKFIFTIIVSLILNVGLSACAKNDKKQSNKETSSQPVKVVNNNKTNAIKSNNNYQLTWNETKKEKLDGFMSNWGQIMGQNYTSYTPSAPGNYYGMTIPNKIFEHNIIVNDSPSSLSWYNKNSSPNNNYQVVACYSDSNDKTYGAKMISHLYLFTIMNDKPIVLITQQTDGNPDNKLYFHETNNQSLKENFTTIIKNKE